MSFYLTGMYMLTNLQYSSHMNRSLIVAAIASVAMALAGPVYVMTQVQEFVSVLP